MNWVCQALGATKMRLIAAVDNWIEFHNNRWRPSAKDPHAQTLELLVWTQTNRVHLPWAAPGQTTRNASAMATALALAEDMSDPAIAEVCAGSQAWSSKQRLTTPANQRVTD